MWVFEIIILGLIVIGLALLFIFKFSLIGAKNYKLANTTPCLNGKAYNIYTCYEDKPCKKGFWSVSYETLFQEVTCSNSLSRDKELKSRVFRPEKLPYNKTLKLKNGHEIEKTYSGWKLDGEKSSLSEINEIFNKKKDLSVESREIKKISEEYFYLLTSQCDSKELFKEGSYTIETEEKILKGQCLYVEPEMTFYVLGQDSKVYMGKEKKVLLLNPLPYEEIAARAALFFKTPKGYYVFLEDKSQGWLSEEFLLTTEPNYFFIENFEDLILEQYTGNSFYQGPLRQALFRDFKKKLPF